MEAAIKRVQREHQQKVEWLTKKNQALKKKYSTIKRQYKVLAKELVLRRRRNQEQLLGNRPYSCVMRLL